jgi:ABC-2 type transport system permease protein
MRKLIAAEYYKLFTTRLWLWLLLAATALTAVYAGLNIAFTDDPDNFAPHLSTPPGQRLLIAIAATPATTFAAVLAAIGLTGEFRHRTATATFLATPHRVRVVAAKLIAYGVVGVAYAAACIAVVVAMGVPWLATMGIDLSLTRDGMPGTIAGVVAAGAAFGLIGVALGALLRDQVAAVVGLLVYRFVAEPIVTAIPALHTWTLYLPGSAASALAGSTLENRDFLDPWLGGLVLAGYLVVLVAAGAALITRRDIT